MLALGIDTSTPNVSVALVENPDGVVARRDRLAENRHGEVLATLIDDVFRETGRSPVDLAAVGVGLGPGPFTGLRVGIVTAASMGDALGVPVYGECSLDVVGRRHRAREGGFAVVFDARRKQVYWALYDESGARTEGPDIGVPSDVADHLRGKATEVVGPGATRYADAFHGFTVADTRWPQAEDLAHRAGELCRSRTTAAPLRPLYLRRPDVREPTTPKRVTPA